jgi:protein-disulfide isomerase
MRVTAPPLATPTQRTPTSSPAARDEEEAWLRARRARRLRRSVGMVLVLVAFVAVAIALTSARGGAPPKPGSPAARHDVAATVALLRGIPQSGRTLGSAHAPVTVTEYADLECSVCRVFALGAEESLIANEVRAGQVKLVYRSLCTATCNGPLGRPGFASQQAAAYAAALQRLGWDYIELFYREQGAEGTNYVTPSYLAGLAHQVPGLEYQKWHADSGLPSLQAQVTGEGSAAAGQGFGSTPTIVVAGPRGRSKPIVGAPDFSTLQAAIKSVR